MLLNAKLTGQIILPDNPDYDCARQVFNTRFSEFPQVIVYCRSARDVANAICWARENNVPLRARCGGHSYEAFSVVNDGIVIDVSCMNGLCVDRRENTAGIEAGNTLLPLYRRLYNHGVTIPGGTCPGVGIAGLTLGGGFGMSSRLWGMTCDNLLAIGMIDAGGREIYADDCTNADLLWASRGGGGGNFGIVTSFKFRVHPVSQVAIFEITWKWDDIMAIINTWQEWAPFTDNRLTSTLKLYTKQQGSITASGQFAGPKRELTALLQPLLAVSRPAEVIIKKVPYIKAAYRWAGFPGDPDKWPRSPVPFKNTGSFAYNRLPGQAIATIIEFLSSSPGKENWLVFQALGGAVNRVPPDATAYVHRCAQFALLFDAFPQQQSDVQANIEWVEEFRSAMLAYTRGAYVNFTDLCIDDWQTAYYGGNLQELIRIKQKYDPDNVFCFPQSIPVANDCVFRD